MLNRVFATLFDWAYNPYGFLARYHKKIFLIHTSFTFGLWFALPLDSYGSSPTFDVLRKVMPELELGIAMMLISGMIALGVLLKSRAIKEVSLLLNSCIWIFLSLLFAKANVASTAAPLCGSVALASVYTMLFNFKECEPIQNPKA